MQSSYKYSIYFKCRVETRAVPQGSRTSLTSSFKGHESDTDSMADYGEGEMGKFGEDGSFIGQYIKTKKTGEPTTPSALATFVWTVKCIVQFKTSS